MCLFYMSRPRFLLAPSKRNRKKYFYYIFTEVKVYCFIFFKEASKLFSRVAVLPSIFSLASMRDLVSVYFCQFLPLSLLLIAAVLLDV